MHKKQMGNIPIFEGKHLKILIKILIQLQNMNSINKKVYIYTQGYWLFHSFRFL